VAGVDAEEVTRRLLAKRIRTSSSPYKVSYARVAAGVMNFPEEIDRVLGEIRAMTAKPA
jgi:selenocysteine lyase/cysteine desulfurase